MKRTKLVILSAFLSPFRSGAEAMAEEVAIRLPEDFDVTIVTAHLKYSLPAHDVIGGGRVRVIRIGIGFGIDKYLFPFLVPLAVRSLKPDIVHAVLESYAGMALVACKWLYPKAKRVLTLQSTNTTLFLRAIHKAPHVITAISSALVARAKTFRRDDVILIPNGIDLTAIHEACAFHTKKRGSILFVGRLEKMKGVDILLRAFAKALPKLPEYAHLTIVGGGSQAGTLKQLAFDLGASNRVTFSGRIAGPEVFDAYAKAEVFCGLSRSEALGNVFLEAQAAGCAVIATNTGGIPDIVTHNVTGLLIEVDNVEQAADAIIKTVTDQNLRTALSEKALKHAEKFDWNGIASQYVDILTKMK